MELDISATHFTLNTFSFGNLVEERVSKNAGICAGNCDGGVAEGLEKVFGGEEEQARYVQQGFEPSHGRLD